MSWSYRPARMTDLFALVEILTERQADSRYADVCEVDQPYARKLMGALVQRHGGTNEGGAFVEVAVRDGKVQAFIAGQLVRIYGIGTKLGSTDVFLIGRKNCPPTALARLFESYVFWAASNPRVVEIGASHNDVISGSEGFASLYRRCGFAECGTSYRRSNIIERKELAA